MSNFTCAGISDLKYTKLAQFFLISVNKIFVLWEIPLHVTIHSSAYVSWLFHVHCIFLRTLIRQCRKEVNIIFYLKAIEPRSQVIILCNNLLNNTTATLFFSIKKCLYHTIMSFWFVFYMQHMPYFIQYIFTGVSVRTS